MALRPLHLLLALALLMIYFETTSSTEENEVYAQEENELETVDELVPRSPGRRRRWGHTAYSRRVGYSRRHGPRQRVRYSRRHGPRQRVRYSRRHGPRQRVRYSRRVRFHRISRKPRKRVGRRIRVHRPGPVRNPCYPSPCRNAGVCLKVRRGRHKKAYTFKCKCKRPFFGTRCERRPARDPCYPSPCRNAGVCLKVRRGWYKKVYTFKCLCRRPFFGTRCEREPNPCDSSPCKNGGICSNKGASFTCQCRNNYIGSTCETKPKPNPCDSSPCKNGGICSNKGAWFTCQCRNNYIGRTCETKPKPNPCDSSPCKNGGICSNKGASFTCQCRNNYIGRTCETKPPNPCSPNPCLNQGVCHVIGNGFSCKCPLLFGGSRCQDEQSSCTAAGDPHYTTFDNKKINFQGKCEYILAEDCSASKSFRVWTKNVACGSTGRGASCVSFVRILIGRDEIKLTRNLRTAIVNGAKVTRFPFKRGGFVITNPTERWLHVVTAIGVRVSWDCRNRVTVVVPGRFKGKTCGLCGNNNGNAADDTINVADYPCVPPDKNCIATADAAPIIEKCDLMKNAPFTACNDAVDPTNFIEDCKFDACRCEDPMQCVCNSFATYSQSCSRNAVVLDWRFSGRYLVPALSQCGQQCSIPSQVFTECGSSCVQSCRDLSRATECNEQCVPGCQCPQGLVLSDDKKCIPAAKCPCEFEGKPLQPGESVAVGNCKTCTCDMGAVKCVEDRNCVSKGPCDSFPCRNDGICSVQGSTFSCQCSKDYQGSTCEELKPKPCDSQPCLNGGVCTNVGSSFSCECSKGFKGDTCADAECVDKKLDILYVVDGSGSIREPNFENITRELKKMNGKFAIGPDKIQIALMQFGRTTDTRIEFKLGEKNTLQTVNEGVDNMKWLSSFKTATGDALKKAREQIFNGEGGDRSTAANVLILFTDGVATDAENKVDQEAQTLKDAGVKVITVAMGNQNFIEGYRSTLQRLASVDDETGQPLQFEAGFDNLNDLTSKLVKGAC